ncbi:low molecular weight phosphatase family protein [Aquamicrobium segne]|uniref:Low molecular weight phosphatase family protein n=1 Tax=Aquamicrobium segne TaxID=469547 RepID=A0ABW0H294_9HYPH
MCDMNTVRSPIAEKLARTILPDDIFIGSAGVHAGERNPFVDFVLAEEGLSLGERQPRSVDDIEDAYFDLIITLSPRAHHLAMEFTRTMAVEVEYWPTFDPTLVTGTREQRLIAYREMRDHLKNRILKRFLHADQGTREEQNHS